MACNLNNTKIYGQNGVAGNQKVTFEDFNIALDAICKAIDAAGAGGELPYKVYVARIIGDSVVEVHNTLGTVNFVYNAGEYQFSSDNLFTTNKTIVTALSDDSINEPSQISIVSEGYMDVNFDSPGIASGQIEIKVYN